MPDAAAKAESPAKDVQPPPEKLAEKPPPPKKETAVRKLKDKKGPAAKVVSHYQYGKLERRKSLSDNCLLSKSRGGGAAGRTGREAGKELDSFGIPRIPRQKRSVSLMRESYCRRQQED